MMARIRQVFAEGSASGELIQVDEMQMMYTALGANVFYFLSAPVMGLLTGTNPLERGALEHRRKAAIEYLGQTVFTDRAYGALVAARVLASTPMPLAAKTEPRTIQTLKMMTHDIASLLQKADEVRHK
jgi:TetR/AcrR family transcriptional regulator